MTARNVMTVRDLVERQSEKGYFTVKAENTIKEAAQEMQARGVSAISVTTNGELVGVLSEKDISHAVAQGRDLTQVRVEAIMIRDIITTDIDTSLGDTAREMISNNIRHLPVLEEGKLHTMVSIRDVLKLLVERLETENEILKADVEWMQHLQR